MRMTRGRRNSKRTTEECVALPSPPQHGVRKSETPRCRLFRHPSQNRGATPARIGWVAAGPTDLVTPGLAFWSMEEGGRA